MHGSARDARLNNAPWLTAPETRKIFDVLEQAGYSVRAVGGTVRNTLLGEPVSDIDLATNALPDKVIAADRDAGLKAVPTGIEHGTVTIVVAGTPFEVTTLRQDVSTDGRRATVAYTDNWVADAKRRDFTINAIYCDRNGHLFDPVGGLDDIAIRKVRFIGDAHQRIREDYLRILRFFRFSAQYANGKLDPVGLAACRAERAGLERLSAERIHREFMRLLEAPAAVATLRAMQEHGFLSDILGTQCDIDALAKLNAIRAANSQSIHGAGIKRLLHFAVLAVADENAARLLAIRLRMSNAEAKYLSAAMSAKQEIDRTTYDAGDLSVKAAVYKFGNEAAFNAIALSWSRGNAPVDSPAFRHLAELAIAFQPPTPPFTGSDVISRGVPAGPRVGVVLASFEHWWVGAGFPEDHSRLARKLDSLIKVTNS